MQLPSSDLVPDFLSRIRRDGWTETTKDLPPPTVSYPRPKREPQKVKLLVRVSPSPIGILAIDHFRLLRMQFQSTLLQPCRYFDTHQVRFPLCSAMDDNIVRVPLERQMTPISPHPQIERVVQKQIGQQRADDSSLWSASFTVPPKYSDGSVIIEVDQLLSVPLVDLATPLPGSRRRRLAVQEFGRVAAGKHRLTPTTCRVATFGS
jgi:hypothetical protein